MRTIILSRRQFGRLQALGGWLAFAVALLTYWLTMEPTASYWDCPEYLLVAQGLEVGHPPGNPVWMLAARMAINFAPDPSHAALMVNALSGLFTALAALLIYLTVCLLLEGLAHKKRLQGEGMALHLAIVRIASGLCAALAMTWSDSVWFSAVEAEVYAFSLFLTALTIYLALLWAKRAHLPHSDRYLILIFYLVGLGMGVHELNLLSLPTVALVVWFRLRTLRSKGNWWRTLLAAGAGVASVPLLLYGVNPLLFALAKATELWMVNTLHCPFNTGLVVSISSLMLLLIALSLYLSLRSGGTLLRICRVAVWGLMFYVLGFCSYGVIIIRAWANPPINQNAPSNIFDFESYYSRDQYGAAPLLRGYAFGAPRLKMQTVAADSSLSYGLTYNTDPRPRYLKARPGYRPLLRTPFASHADSLSAAGLQSRTDDFYLLNDYSYSQVRVPQMKMWLPRLWSDTPSDVQSYLNWLGTTTASFDSITDVTWAVDTAGNPVASYRPDNAPALLRPTYMQNLQYFLVYQTSFMYWRYFFWNFVGRQNDFTGHGEPDAGMTITGLNAIDNLYLGNVSKAPADIAAGNKGRNVYWFLPLIFGLWGLCWQCRRGRAGRCGATVVASLFFFTGLAIVVYLNQTPVQARDRDYAFLGSYYAFCIWIGLGIAALHSLLVRYMSSRRPLLPALIAALVALAIPLQMLSQTADDHDRSHRTATPDMAYNLLTALPPNAIMFVNGDNDTFPLWYMQEVEGVRPDVRVISLPYLSLTTYTDNLYLWARNSAPLPLSVPRADLAVGRYNYVSLGNDSTEHELLPALKAMYASEASQRSVPSLPGYRYFVVYDTDTLHLDLRNSGLTTPGSHTMRQESLLIADILATSAASASPRPIGTLADKSLNGLLSQLMPSMRTVSRTAILDPAAAGPDYAEVARLAATDFRFGSVSSYPYFDPVTGSQVTQFRRTLITTAGYLAADKATAPQALQLLRLVERQMPPEALPYAPCITPKALLFPESSKVAGLPEDEVPQMVNSTEAIEFASALWKVSRSLSNPALAAEAKRRLAAEERRLSQYQKYIKSLNPTYRAMVTNRVAALSAALSYLRSFPH